MNKTRRNKKIFTDKNYNSNDGFLTTVWGPPIWHFLHTISFNYPVNPPDDVKKNYSDFILNLENILPCGKCRKNFNSQQQIIKQTNCNNLSQKVSYQTPLFQTIRTNYLPSKK